jgi:uncharacterized membrane-anchored protein YjiN (DUF445 family)
MKTTIISIPSCSASETLKSLHQNNIPCKYVGLDQAGRILMELKIEKNHEKLIAQLIMDIEKTEQFLSELQQVINETIKKLTEESNKKWDDLIKDFKPKNRRSTVTN